MKNVITLLVFLFSSFISKAQYTEIAMNNNGGLWLLGSDKTVTTVNAGLTGWTAYPGGGLGLHLRSNRGTPLLVGMNEGFFPSNGQNWYELSGGGRGKLIVSDQVTGEYWCIGSDQSIFSFNGQSWALFPGGAHVSDLAVHNKMIYCIGRSDTKIYRLVNSSTGRFEWLANGLGKRITIDAKTGTPWCIGTGDDIFRFDGQKWVVYGNGSGKGKEIAVYNDVPYVIANDGTVWRGVNGAWVQVLKKTSSTAVMTKFNPAIHGYKFVNNFDTHLFVGGGIQFTLSGLCGGMSYSAMDYYKSNTPIPTNTTQPNEGTQLTQYIRSRQIMSIAIQYEKWAELGLNPFGWRTSEFWQWGVQGFNGGRLQELKTQIDNGNPVVLGLFAAGSGGFTTKHHQVIAIGYDMGRYKGDLGSYKEDLKIFICDPNFPTKTMTLKPYESKLRYCYEEDQSKEWLTYFVDLKYTPTQPLDPNVIGRCTNQNLANQNFRGQNHSGKVYRCANAAGAIFYGAQLSNTDFENADLSGAIFQGATGNNTNFANTKLPNTNFQGATINTCNFSNSNLTNVHFWGTTAGYATMNGANAEGGNFQGANLGGGKYRYTSFKNARLYGTDIHNSDCSFANFSGANLDGADLRGNTLTGANFNGAIVTRNTKFDQNSISQVKNWPGVK